MPEAVRTLQKLGAKNRAINASLKEVLATIKANREAKLKAEQEERVKKIAERKANEGLQKLPEESGSSSEQ